MMQTDASVKLDGELAGWRTQVDRALDEWTSHLPGSPPRLVEAIRYSLLSPGKRLRPIVLLLANQACGGDPEQALPAACALEMLHSYSLVHDDLPAMDDDDLRRGQPTCHVKYGEATAILVGDALLTLAFETLADRLRPPALALRCVQLLAHAAGHSQLIGGQFDDLAAENRQLMIEELEFIQSRKTAMLFSTAAEMGGLIAGGSAEQIGQLAEFGHCLGLSFQIVDDLLDVEGQEIRLGKRTQKDKTRGKSTYPLIAGVESSRRRAVELIERAVEQLSIFGEQAEPLKRFVSHLAHRTS